MSDQTQTTDRPQPRPTYLNFDGMTWPDPDDPLEIEWTLRYGTPTRAQLLAAASMIAAYKQLVADPQVRRNAKIAGIRRAQAGGGRR